MSTLRMTMMAGAFVCVVLVIGAPVAATIYNNASPEDAFKECLVTKPHGGLGYCIGYGALTKLQALESRSEFDLIDGLKFTRDEKMYRDGYSVVSETDPSDFRSVLGSWVQVFQARTMKWNMGFVYPGLAMRVAPGGLGGVLEFVMDSQNPYQQHSLKEASTGQVLARQFLVPLLLGFKFNIVSVLPVFFGIIALLAKKAVVLSKIALVLSSAYSLSSLLFTPPAPPSYPYGYQPTYNPSFGAHHSYRVPSDDEYQDVYRTSKSAASPLVESTQQVYNNNNNNNNNADQLHLYDAELQKAFNREEKNDGRNFAWTEKDKNLQN